MFFTILGCWVGGGGVSQGIGTRLYLLMLAFFTLDSSKIEVFKTGFFDIVTT